MAWILALLVGFAGAVGAQTVEVTDDAPTTGREKAAGYFKDRKASSGAAAASAPADPNAPRPRYLAVRLGTFISDQSFKWGHDSQSNSGKFNAGVDYRLGEWVNTADFGVRFDYSSYGLAEGTARKLAVNASVSFPDANSRFPLYFGAAIGPGFFIKQITNESVMSLDYSLFAGGRMLDLYEKIGAMVELGLKDHVLLFSDGQFNGFYFNVGAVFVF